MNDTDIAKCELCGEPMPPGETMFKFHGYSGPCPKPPLVYKPKLEDWVQLRNGWIIGPLTQSKVAGRPFAVSETFLAWFEGGAYGIGEASPLDIVRKATKPI